VLTQISIFYQKCILLLYSLKFSRKGRILKHMRESDELPLEIGNESIRVIIHIYMEIS
jgi:hypothetical protein